MLQHKNNSSTLLLTIVIVTLMLLGYIERWGEDDVYITVGVALIGVIALIKAILREEAVRLDFIDAFVAGAALYSLMNAIFLSSPYPIAYQTVQTTLFVCLYAFLRMTLKDKDYVIVFAVIVVGSIETVIALLQLFGLLGYSAIRGQITGTFQNPGPLGIFLAVAIVTGIALYRQFRRRWMLISILPMIILLPSTFSRTALFSLMVSYAIMMHRVIRQYWLVVLIGVSSACIAFYLFKQESADSRTFMGMIAVRNWLDAFWLGHGVGSYIPTLANGQIHFFSADSTSAYIACVGTTDRAFCEYLRMAVEQGIIGLLFLCSIIVVALRNLLRHHSPLVYTLIVLCITAFFSYPFHLQQFCLLLVLILSQSAEFETKEKISLRARLFLIFFSVATIIVTILLAIYTLRHKSFNRDAATFMYMQDTCFVDDYYEMLPMMTDNRDFLFDFGVTLRKARRYNDSNAILRMGTQLDTDPMTLVLMGRNFEDMCLYDEADSLYQRAFLLQPNRLYPLYRQLKLYESFGDSEKMITKAHEVVAFKPKIDSPAVHNMKTEAEQILLLSETKNLNDSE